MRISRPGLTPAPLILPPAVPVGLLALTLAALLTFSAQASAEGAWWHLTSGARPARIEPGLATDEVRKLSVQASAGTYKLKEPVAVNNAQSEEEGVNVTTLPAAAKPSEIRTHLEALYGPANVRVNELAPKEFKITFKGARADQPVELQAAGEVTLSREARGRADGEIYATAENLGDQTISGESSAVKLTDMLPAGLKAVSIAATEPPLTGEVLRRVPLPCDLSTLSCELKSNLVPYDQLEMRILVVAAEDASSGESNAVSVSGGEGFSCQEVSAGTGKYKGSGCVLEGPGEFERTAAGPVAPASLLRGVALGEAPVPFGVEDYELSPEADGGATLAQAGAHPFQLTTTITLNQTADARPLENFSHKPSVNPVALPRDLHFQWPPGLIGNPNPKYLAQCTDADFFRSVDSGGANLCSPQSAVGVATVTVNEPSLAEVTQLTVPLFNMVPRKGEPARFGFNVLAANAPVVIDTAVRSGGDYGVTVSSDTITQTAALLSSQVTVWGVPGELSHNRQRGWACLAESHGRPIEAPLKPCSQTATHQGDSPPAFLSLPTACTGPLPSTVLGDSWSDPLPVAAFPTLASASLPALQQCSSVPFSPSIDAAPDSSSASSPTGFAVNLHVPQAETLNAKGRAEGAVKDINVALPQGLSVNPSAADGLEACSESLAGFTGFAEFLAPNQSATFTPGLPDPLRAGLNFCADAAEVATVKVKTPILENPIEGGVYLASQNQNPFGSLIALYLIASDPISGVVVKLTGETKLSADGQITASFQNNPQAPFEDAELHFFAGPRAPLATPAHCGSYETTSSLTPWSGAAAATPSSAFQITSGPGGGPCPGATLPFAPSLTSGTSANAAGSYGVLSTTIERGDGQQAIQSVKLHTPAGLAGILTGVTLCTEADANAGACPANSQIGQTTVAGGVGESPVVVPGGKVYLTEHYEGAPFGLAITEPVKAGPFDLEHDTANPGNQPACDCLVVRAKIDVDPHTAELTASTEQIPSMVDDIAVQLKKLNVRIDRQNFTFNPTNCDPLQITATVNGYEGASQPLSSPFQAANCQNLKFAPTFKVSTSGKTSKANGTSLKVKLTYPNAPLGAYANLAKAKVSLPKQLPSRLSTLNKACTSQVFDQNPANCPKESAVGSAKVITPVLPVPLTGTAYLVSHAAEAFPDLTIVLKGYGITVDLIGSTQIKNGITTSTFKATPDVPFSSFELNLPAGKFSVLTANANLCASKLSMPTEFTAQNGALIQQNTPISVTGCKKTLTKRQKLAKALKSCKKRFGQAKKRRRSCEGQARRRYGVGGRGKKG
jgi:hypothetical protein